MDNRVINIQTQYITRAASDEQFCAALALNLMIKAKYVDSIVKNYGVRQFARDFHIKSGIKEIVDFGLSEGLFEIISRTDKRGKQHNDLKALPIIKEGQISIRFHICNSRHGKQIFLKSNFQDNNKKYSKAKSYQRLRDVMCMIWLAKVTCIVGFYAKRYDSELHKAAKELGLKIPKGYSAFSHNAMYSYAKKVKTHDIGKFEFLNTGISQERIRSIFWDNISPYMVKKLIKIGIEDKLIKSEKNSLCIAESINQHKDDDFGLPIPDGRNVKAIFRYIEDKEARRQNAVHEEYIERNEYGEIVVDYSVRGYHGKGGSAKKLFIRMANSYFLWADIYGYKVKYNSNKKVA